MNRLALLSMAAIAAAGLIRIRTASAADLVLFDGQGATGFENGAAVYNSASGTAGNTAVLDTSTIDPLSGQAALAVNIAGDSTHYPQIGVNASEAGTVNVPITDTYLSFDVKDAGGAGIYLQETDTYGSNSPPSAVYTIDGVPLTSSSQYTDGNWHRIVMDFAAAFPTDFAAGTKLAELGYGAGNVQTDYFADVVFTSSPTGPAGSSVPEPASLGLLTVGALALLRRRRT